MNPDLSIGESEFISVNVVVDCTSWSNVVKTMPNMPKPAAITTPKINPVLISEFILITLKVIRLIKKWKVCNISKLICKY